MANGHANLEHGTEKCRKMLQNLTKSYKKAAKTHRCCPKAARLLSLAEFRTFGSESSQNYTLLVRFSGIPHGFLNSPIILHFSW